jgi:hypothetical protein
LRFCGSFLAGKSPWEQALKCVPELWSCRVSYQDGVRLKVGAQAAGFSSMPKLRIPSSEYILQFVVQYLGSGLQQQVCALQHALHLFFLTKRRLTN